MKAKGREKRKRSQAKTKEREKDFIPARPEELYTHTTRVKKKGRKFNYSMGMDTASCANDYPRQGPSDIINPSAKRRVSPRLHCLVLG